MALDIQDCHTAERQERHCKTAEVVGQCKQEGVQVVQMAEGLDDRMSGAVDMTDLVVSHQNIADIEVLPVGHKNQRGC